MILHSQLMSFSSGGLGYGDLLEMTYGERKAYFKTLSEMKEAEIDLALILAGKKPLKG